MPIQTEYRPPTLDSSQPQAQHLKRTLKTRHVNMLALGGVIGAGLFVGSSAIIAQTGPAAFITYAITGLIVGLVMRMLGEMAAAQPAQGSFVEYARMAYGNAAGYTIGWLYWYFWVIVVGFEAVVGGQIIHEWLPHIPVWMIALSLMVVMTALNLLSVHSFGEAEYWFAGIKVAAIVAFIAITAAWVLHLLPQSTAGWHHLSAHGGFFPKGIGTLFTGVVVVIFSMTGVEVATIAAAESEDPERNIRRCVNTVMLRILVFFVTSTFLIALAQPWTHITPGKSPFVTTLETIGIPGAATMLTIVILTAVLSVLNAGLYTASRLLFVLSMNREAPQWMTTINRRGVPIWGVLASTLVGYGCVVIARVWPDTVFLFLINSSGAVFLFVCLMICLSQLKLRQRWINEGRLTFKIWGHPWLPLAVTATIVAVLVSMALNPETQISLLQSVIALLAFLFSWFVVQQLQSQR